MRQSRDLGSVWFNREECPAQLRSLRFLCNWSRLQNYSYPFPISRISVSLSLTRSLECVGDLRDIKDLEVNCQKLTPLQNLITLSHLSLSTIHSITHFFFFSFSLSLYLSMLSALSVSVSVSFYTCVYHSCYMRIYEFV